MIPVRLPSHDVVRNHAADQLLALLLDHSWVVLEAATRSQECGMRQWG